MAAAAEVGAAATIPVFVDVSEIPECASSHDGDRGGVTPKSSVSATPSVKRAVSQVYKSFTSPRRLVLAAGTVLALCAGIVDAVCFNQLGQFTTHVTGNVAHIGIRLEGNYDDTYTLVETREAFLLVMSFLCGSIICGLIISKNDIHFGKELYGFALLGNSFLLVAATLCPNREVAMYLAAAAAGLQNGICTMHFGAVCRTTHVTGLVTDLGTAIGRILAIVIRRLIRRQKLDILDSSEIEVDATRIKVYCLLIFGFFFGALFGSLLDHHWGIWAMLVPASITFLGGSSYMVFHICLKDKLKEWEEERVNEEIMEVETILTRTRSFLAHRASEDGDMDNPHFVHLAGTMSHMNEVMHDVEASIEQLYGNHLDHAREHADPAAAAASAQSSPARRPSRAELAQLTTAMTSSVASEPGPPRRGGLLSRSDSLGEPAVEV